MHRPAAAGLSALCASCKGLECVTFTIEPAPPRCHFAFSRCACPLQPLTNIENAEMSDSEFELGSSSSEEEDSGSEYIASEQENEPSEVQQPQRPAARGPTPWRSGSLHCGCPCRAAAAQRPGTGAQTAASRPAAQADRPAAERLQGAAGPAGAGAGWGERRRAGIAGDGAAAAARPAQHQGRDPGAGAQGGQGLPAW